MAEHTYIVITPNYWGRGPSLNEAKAELTQVGGKLAQYVAFELPDGAVEPYVSPIGQLCWTWEEGADRTVKPTVVASRAVDLDGDDFKDWR